MADYERDPRYVDIGDLLTGFAPYEFKNIYMRQFVLEDLNLLHTGMSARIRPYSHIVRAVQMACSVDVTQLTDGDFEYVMAWLRKHSYPDFPMIATYTCKNLVVLRPDNSIAFDVALKDADAQGFRVGHCDGENKELVKSTRIRVKTLDDDDLLIKDPDIDFPRVGTLTDYYDVLSEKPHLRYIGALARWVKRGKDFNAKLLYLMSQPDMSLFERIEDHQKRYYHGITEAMSLVCGQCGHKMEHESRPRLLSFFADNSEQDIYNMSYNMLTHLGAQPDMKMPAKLFFYHHSTFITDKREADKQAQARQQQSTRNRQMGQR